MAPLFCALIAALSAGAGAHRRALPAVDGFPTGKAAPDSSRHSRALAEFGADQTQPAGLSRSNSGGDLTSPIVPQPSPRAEPRPPDTYLTASFVRTARLERPDLVPEPFRLLDDLPPGPNAQEPDNNRTAEPAPRHPRVRWAATEAHFHNTKSPPWPSISRYKIYHGLNWPTLDSCYHCSGIMYELCVYVALHWGSTCPTYDALSRRQYRAAAAAAARMYMYAPAANPGHHMSE